MNWIGDELKIFVKVSSIIIVIIIMKNINKVLSEGRIQILDLFTYGVLVYQ